MEPVLLGLAAPTAKAAGNLVQDTVQSARQPFAAMFQKAAEALETTESPTSTTSETSPAPLARDQDPHYSLLSELLTGRASEDSLHGVSISDIRQHADNLQHGIERRIQEALSVAGIQVDEPLRIRISEFDGSLEVASDHKQRALIESVLAQDKDLAADVRRLMSLGQLVSAADQDRKFAEAYKDNPWQAVADFSHLFESGRANEMKVLVNSESARLEFV